ncbi:zinc finger protein 423-like [Pectinophora gossypiella]|uniref:zinc finger protein 423-like n=1 Tax=Pectinophora gossypiella TaxID=13191 RepID=UPI00214E8985|nr:zinc finger protein 423-like [Pectinophora gossypiella]
MILLCSNATPIRCHAGVGYKCCFCSDQYAKPSDLKEHTLSKHDDETKASFMKRATMVRYIVKLDISWLACKLCGGNMKTLEDLISHLVSKHEKVYYSDIKNHIIPFKFETEGLKCAVCCNDFNNFKVLLEHMNVHFKNHVCEVCGCGFVNKHTLQCHSYRHITGVFNCSHCPKVFDTKVKRRDHERSVHVKASKTNKCGYCDEKFSDYRKKKDHEVKEHGATPLVLKCQACDETFNDQTLLTVHTKTYHLMERRIPH